MKYIVPFIFILLICACAPTSYVSYGSLNVLSSHKLSTDTFRIEQIDSMTVADNLPNMKKWERTVMQDYESGLGYNYYTIFNTETNVLYTSKQLNDKNYVVIKKKLKV